MCKLVFIALWKGSEVLWLVIHASFVFVINEIEAIGDHSFEEITWPLTYNKVLSISENINIFKRRFSCICQKVFKTLMNGLYVLGPMIHDTSKFIVNQTRSIKDDCLKLSLNLLFKYFFRVPLNGS